MQFCSIPFYFTIFILPLFLLIAESKGSEIEIVANGGIVSWVDKELSHTKLIQVTGLPVQKLLEVILSSFTTVMHLSKVHLLFKFPNDSNKLLF